MAGEHAAPKETYAALKREIFREVQESYRTALMDPANAHRLEAFEDGIRDEMSRILFAMRRAKEKAVAEATLKARHEDAKRAKEHGIDPTIIAEACGLTLEEVEGL